eukprot:TRINITY_DN33134_c0_g1_i4.p1 TRINITY_DN33134_c0_g1~~TRINITY_DN33134_c0_g1_i4.p1  ORF type:complete len:164 (+),score=70.42 TRINITY_DN33134_c0_g1_i4:370-861(+)
MVQESFNESWQGHQQQQQPGSFLEGTGQGSEVFSQLGNLSEGAHQRGGQGGFLSQLHQSSGDQPQQQQSVGGRGWGYADQGPQQQQQQPPPAQQQQYFGNETGQSSQAGQQSQPQHGQFGGQEQNGSVQQFGGYQQQVVQMSPNQVMVMQPQGVQFAEQSRQH